MDPGLLPLVTGSDEEKNRTGPDAEQLARHCSIPVEAILGHRDSHGLVAGDLRIVDSGQSGMLLADGVGDGILLSSLGRELLLACDGKGSSATASSE